MISFLYENSWKVITKVIWWHKKPSFIRKWNKYRRYYLIQQYRVDFFLCRSFCLTLFLWLTTLKLPAENWVSTPFKELNQALISSEEGIWKCVLIFFRWSLVGSLLRMSTNRWRSPISCRTGRSIIWWQDWLCGNFQVRRIVYDSQPWKKFLSKCWD